jgi:hypothetical protein
MTNLRQNGANTEKESGNCHHHWLIDEASGAQSRARCKLCGERRMFYNVFEDTVRQTNQPRSPTD